MLAVMLVIGFAVHNATEGSGSSPRSPVNDRRGRFWRCSG